MPISGVRLIKTEPIERAFEDVIAGARRAHHWRTILMTDLTPGQMRDAIKNGPEENSPRFRDPSLG